jgi:hypothetical protein
MFVGERLVRHSGEIDLGKLGIFAWVALGGLAGIYGVANGFLALAWRRILGFLATPLSRSTAISIYGISQLAKYVPGNIFHFAGRQALGVAAGLPGVPLAKSVFWELGTVCVAGGLFAPLVVSVLGLSGFEGLGAALFIFCLGLVYLLTRQFVDKGIGQALLYQAFFHFLAALVFVGVLVVVQSEVVIPLSLVLPLIGGYVVAWLAGFVTPGAPAGVGVREAILVFLFSGGVAEGTLLMAIVVSRVVTVVGDSLFFGMAWWLGSLNKGGLERG